MFEATAAPDRASAAPAGGLALSDEQGAALRAPFAKSAVICAGAGAGKTRLLAERVTALVNLGAVPSRVAVVTFTRRAATEMSSRILAKLGDKRKLPAIGTVHALALSVATRRKLPFMLATPEQQLSLMDELAELLPPDFEPMSSAELLLAVSCAREGNALGSVAGLLSQVYEEKLESAGLGDFTSLLIRASNKTLDWFDHVIVDEAQDLSVLQLMFLRAVAPRAKFWFIGDPDQAIYSFRGAHASMMHRLIDETDALYILRTNYRSGTRIVTHANNVISNNPGRLDIAWKAHRTKPGVVEAVFHKHGDAELAFAREWLQAAPATRCVLARTQALLAPLKAEKLRALTVHESKGLEWDEVMVLGCEAALFPHPLAALEEERRLFYVAMTRARDGLTLSAAGSRSTKGPALQTRSPSLFLYETQALQAKS
jgi:superfamily I DNA/RNA helicase